MLIDSLNLATGSSITNAVIESGSTLPSVDVTAGTLFFKTGSELGLYYYNGSVWNLAATGETSDIAYVNVEGDSMTGALTLAGAPTQNLHAATKAYVDTALTSAATGLDFKDSVKLATTSNITLAGAQYVDGVGALANIGDRILVKNQTNAAENGIYNVNSGLWTRAADFDGNPGNEVTAGAYCYVEYGDANGGAGFVVSTGGEITIGTTPITFTKITSSVTQTVPYDVATFCSGKPTASENVLSLKVVTAFNLAANLVGSIAVAGTAATGTAVFNVKKNGVQLVTITFAAAGTTGTFGTCGATTINVGDVLTIEAPASADTTIADIMFTLKGVVA